MGYLCRYLALLACSELPKVHVANLSEHRQGGVLRPPLIRNTKEEGISLMEAGNVAEASLEHDLGEGIDEGYRLVPWIAEHGVWSSKTSDVQWI